MVRIALRGLNNNGAMPVAIFDLDGTLTDPGVGITRSVQHALRALGKDVPNLQSLTGYIGPPLRESFARIGGVAPTEIERAIALYREYFTETGIFENQVYSGIPACLETLRSRGWQLAVGTSKPTVFAERILDHFGLRDAFEVVVGSELDGTRDAKEEVIRFGLEMMHVAASSSCLMIGDRSHDIIGARAVSIKAVGVTWGYGSESELAEAGADWIVHHPNDLVDTLRAIHH